MIEIMTGTNEAEAGKECCSRTILKGRRKEAQKRRNVLANETSTSCTLLKFLTFKGAVFRHVNVLAAWRNEVLLGSQERLFIKSVGGLLNTT